MSGNGKWGEAFEIGRSGATGHDKGSFRRGNTTGFADKLPKAPGSGSSKNVANRKDASKLHKGSSPKSAMN